MQAKTFTKNAYAVAKGTGIVFIGTIIGMLLCIPRKSYHRWKKRFISVKTNLILVINMGIRAKARYEDKVLKPLEELGLEEGEEVEIELKERKILGERRDILRYAGILKDMSKEEDKIFLEAVKRRSLFGRVLKL